MKNLKWLIELAGTKPLLFGIALLLLGITELYRQVKQREEDITRYRLEKKVLEERYTRKIDSITGYYVQRELKLNEEVKKTLNDIIEGYKYQLDEQKRINREITGAINRNRNLIDKTKTQLKRLDDE